jgi:hypothetical protein
MIDVADHASAFVDGGNGGRGIEGRVVGSRKLLFARLRRIKIEERLVIAHEIHHEALETAFLR